MSASRDDKMMPLMAHLRELRNVLIKCAIVLVITSGIALAFTTQILHFLLAQHLAVECERLVFRRRMKVGRGRPQEVPAEVGLPGAERLLSGHLREHRREFRLPHVQVLAFGDAHVREVGLPIVAGGVRDELLHGPLVVVLLRVAEFHEGPRGLCQPGLQGHDGSGRRFGRGGRAAKLPPRRHRPPGQNPHGRPAAYPRRSRSQRRLGWHKGPGDRTAGALRIVDYKMASNKQKYANLLKKENMGETSFQMPVYLLAAADAVKRELGVDCSRMFARYWLLRKIIVLDKDLGGNAKEDFTGFFATGAEERRDLGDDNFLNRLCEKVESMKSGDFQITPRECEFCDFGAVCRYVEVGLKEEE